MQANNVVQVWLGNMDEVCSVLLLGIVSTANAACVELIAKVLHDVLQVMQVQADATGGHNAAVASLATVLQQGNFPAPHVPIERRVGFLGKLGPGHPPWKFVQTCIAFAKLCRNPA